MTSRNHNQPSPSEITPEPVYQARRRLLMAGAALPLLGLGACEAGSSDAPSSQSATPRPAAEEEQTRFEDASTYNNFYEFGTGKADPARYAHTLQTAPWSVQIAGHAEETGSFTLEDILKPHTLEDRIYRLRCVEGWSMVIPWVGFQLSDLLAKVEPLGSAKYVAFETLVRPDEMSGQRGFFQPLDWPYVEGLRLDEAMHPLTILATGIYGEELPNQNGAPLRLVVPWKYGFKSIKSIVKITLTEKQPPMTWNIVLPNEYGFYSNVNPQVDHPRWSQASERVIGGGLLTERKPTLMFNGYEEEVADLYAGMDLKKFF